MIKPITFQGAVNFKASLYALEIRSRFIDQANANGFFKNYGQELAMINSSPTTITIGTGAFCVQGRMAEVTSQEVINIDYSSNMGGHELVNNVGYVIAKIQTYQLNSENNCSFLVRIGSSFSSLNSGLTQMDTYSYDSDSANKIYELPIYSFEIDVATGELANITKLIQPIDDYNKVYQLMQSMQTLVEAIQEVANNANELSINAESLATEANEIALTAGVNSLDAKNSATTAVAVANEAKSKVDELGDQIVEKQGTKVVKNGQYLTTYSVDNNLTTADTIRIFGGNSVK
jgi:hypothetical protein